MGYSYPVSMQIILPENYQVDSEFVQQLKVLQKLNFYGVELNIADFNKVALNELQTFLQDFDLKMTMLASGLTAKTFDLSLSSQDDQVRQKTVSKCKEMIDYVAGHDIGIIIGFMKGGIAADVSIARELVVESLKGIEKYTAEKKVKILLEATNKRETSIANTLIETVGLIENFNNPFLQILPDTYHMYYEEDQNWEVLKEYRNYFNSIHFSDHNRYFPGLGTIQFDKIINFLKEMNYQGGVAIEGNIKNNFAEDVEHSMNYLFDFIMQKT
jgi:sugar phosphate isomerase/epimerase